MVGQAQLLTQTRPRMLPCVVLLAVILNIAWFDVSHLAASSEVESVVLPSRVVLVPWLLDAMRRILEKRLGHKVSLLVRPANGFSISESGLDNSWLLLEDGTPAPSNRQPTQLHLSLYWMLGARIDLLSKVASVPPATLDEFEQILARLRAEPLPVFPWFEALYSPMTLRCFALCWASGSIATKSTDVVFLQRALDHKLLNPYSVDADETLAFEVFEAGDAVFSMLWVPSEAISPDSDLRGSLNRVVFLPPPGPKGAAPSPRIDFTLWTPVGKNPPNLHYDSALASPSIRSFPLNQKQDEQWIQLSFPKIYDCLVQGGGE